MLAQRFLHYLALQVQPTQKRLIGSDDVIRRLGAGEDSRSIQQSFMDSVDAFVKLREQYLLYR